MRNPQYGGKPLPDWDSITRGHAHECRESVSDVKRLFLYRDQIMFDVDSQISMVMSSRNFENNALDNYTEKYKSMFTRWIGKYVSKVKERLIIAVIEGRNTSKGDTLQEKGEWEILLRFPDWWDEAAWDPLVECVHDYVVNAVLWEWSKVALSGKDMFTADKGEDMGKAWDKMRVFQTMHKPGSVRKKMRPMGF